MRRRRAHLLALLALACCRTQPFVAELTSKQAVVERDFARAPELWSAANKGDRFALGDGLRTGPRALASLALPHRARLLVKSDTIVRFKRSLDGAQPRDQIEMQRGELTIDTGALDLGVSTPRGVVKLARGSSVRLQAEAHKTHFDVVVGHVEYSLEGVARSVAAGGGFDLEVLPASAEPALAPAHNTPAQTTPPPSAAPREPEKPAADGVDPKDPLTGMTFQEPPSSAIVTLPAGESATIHDPAPPCDVRMLVNRCPELAVLELDRGKRHVSVLRARGTGEVRASIPHGSFDYRVRCVRDGHLRAAPVTTGHLTILTDAATRPLPSAPATITADADGRRYTVSYQNRLPVITLRWPDAPPASAYRLFVRSDGGAEFSQDSSRSSLTLEAGRIGEGVHQFWFATQDGKHSDKGLLQISFDYTARTAYLTSPIEGEPARAGRTRFAGGTLLGSSVQAQGVPLTLDATGRFDAEVDLPEHARGTYVRVQHRSTGIHYYIRHLH